MKTVLLLIDQAHYCFSHLERANLCKLATIAEIKIYSIFSPCKAYILAKITKNIIRSLIAYIMQIINLFYNNLVGPITHIRYNKILYFQIAIKDYLCLE